MSSFPYLTLSPSLELARLSPRAEESIMQATEIPHLASRVCNQPHQGLGCAQPVAPLHSPPHQGLGCTAPCCSHPHQGFVCTKHPVAPLHNQPHQGLGCATAACCSRPPHPSGCAKHPVAPLHTVHSPQSTSSRFRMHSTLLQSSSSSCCSSPESTLHPHLT